MPPDGARLIAVDPTDYELAGTEVEAETAVLEAERQQLDAVAESIGSLLEIERDRLTLAEREFDRARTLYGHGVLPNEVQGGAVLRRDLQHRQAQ